MSMVHRMCKFRKGAQLLALLAGLGLMGTWAIAADDSSSTNLYSDTLQVGDLVKVTLEHPEWNGKPPAELNATGAGPEALSRIRGRIAKGTDDK